MRYIKDIMLEAAFMHILDAGSDEVLISKKALTINEYSEEFIRKHIIKCLNDDETVKARPFSDTSYFVENAKLLIKDWNNLKDVSATFAETLFKSVKNTDLIPCDFLMVQYIADEQRCFAILKLDHTERFKHDINFEGEDLVISLSSDEVALPNAGTQIRKAVFFTKAPEDTIDIIVINKREAADDGDEDYFTKWLDLVIVRDDTETTRKLRPNIERWTQKCLSDQIETAQQIRASVDSILLSDDTISIDKVSDMLFPGDDTKEIKAMFTEDLRAAGIPNQVINIDKTYIEKKMKKKIIKTDTGVSITNEFDFYKDSQKYIEKKNGDGTIDIILKNVRNIIVK